MIKIDKGVPMPRSGDKTRKYPFPDMEVGDSFFIEGDPSNIRWAASNWGKHNGGRKFSILKSEGGHRIWRIA